MEIVVFIAILVGAFFAYQQYVKSTPAHKNNIGLKQIKRLEEAADSLYSSHTHDVSEAIDRIKEKLTNEKSYLMIGDTKEDVKKDIKNNQDYLDDINKVRNNYIKLSERYAHSPIAQKLEIAQDWYKYMDILLQITINRRYEFNYTDIDSQAEKDLRSQMKDDWNRVEEITKRFESKAQTV